MKNVIAQFAQYLVFVVHVKEEFIEVNFLDKTLGYEGDEILKTREQIVEELASMNCESCGKHGVHYSCAKDGLCFCKKCWKAHLTVHPEGYHLDTDVGQEYLAQQNSVNMVKKQ